MTVASDFAPWILIVGFAVMGIGSFVKPELVTAQFGIPTLSIAGRNEVRAVYGGFGILMLCALCIALVNPTLRSGIYFTVALALVGMAAGRTISWIIDRKIDKWPFFYLLLEMVCGSMIAMAV